MKTKPRLILLANLVLLECLGIAGAGAEEISYSFSRLSPGPLGGQDGWSQGKAVVQSGLNDRKTPVIAGTTDAEWSHYRFFDSMEIKETTRTVIFEFDMAPLVDGGKVVAIGPVPGGYKMGLPDFNFGFLLGNLFVAPGRTWDVVTAHQPLMAGDWYRLRAVVDLAAQEGNGEISVFIKNVSAEQEEFAPVKGLQNIKMNLLPGSSERWKGIWMRLNGPCKADNLSVKALP